MVIIIWAWPTDVWVKKILIPSGDSLPSVGKFRRVTFSRGALFAAGRILGVTHTHLRPEHRQGCIAVQASDAALSRLRGWGTAGDAGVGTAAVLHCNPFEERSKELCNNLRLRPPRARAQCMPLGSNCPLSSVERKGHCIIFMMKSRIEIWIEKSVCRAFCAFPLPGHVQSFVQEYRGRKNGLYVVWWNLLLL